MLLEIKSRNLCHFERLANNSQRFGVNHTDKRSVHAGKYSKAVVEDTYHAVASTVPQ